MCNELPLDEIYPPNKFHNDSNYSSGDMHRTKVKFESKQRAITKKKKKKEKSKQELWFICTALPLDEIYLPTKFHNHSLFSLRDMQRKKSKYKKQRAIIKKLSKQELQFIYTVLPLEKIYAPTKFHNHSKYSFRDFHQTKL